MIRCYSKTQEHLRLTCSILQEFKHSHIGTGKHTRTMQLQHQYIEVQQINGNANFVFNSVFITAWIQKAPLATSFYKLRDVPIEALLFLYFIASTSFISYIYGITLLHVQVYFKHIISNKSTFFFSFTSIYALL